MLSVIIFWSRKDCIRAQYQIFYYLWLSRETRSGCPEELLYVDELPFSARNSTQQSAIAECFAEANWLYSNYLGKKIPSKIYIQFTIVNTYFSTKLSLTNKRYHLHVPEMCLCATRSQISYYVILILFFHVATDQALLSRLISSYRRNPVASHV